jgi:4-hydroxybenzoate polyprenyltransferase
MKKISYLKIQKQIRKSALMLSTKKLFSYFELLRLNRPIGIWLLLWPSFCGLALAAANLFEYLLFLFGTIALRSAGCVINDMVDVNFDKHVKRSKNRPLAAGTVNITEALWLIFICLNIGLYVWLQLSTNAKMLSVIAAVMMVIYPFLKRFTYWPQVFLGFTFNIGFLIALANKNVPINISHLLLYVALIFWTIFYDTIYAFSDITDDLKIGVKSSAIKMQKHPKIWLTIINCILFALIIFSFRNTFAIAIGILGFIYLQYLLSLWQSQSDDSCIETFKKCHYFGLGLWLSLELVRIIAP